MGRNSRKRAETRRFNRQLRELSVTKQTWRRIMERRFHHDPDALKQLLQQLITMSEENAEGLLKKWITPDSGDRRDGNEKTED